MGYPYNYAQRMALREGKNNSDTIKKLVEDTWYDLNDKKKRQVAWFDKNEFESKILWKFFRKVKKILED